VISDMIRWAEQREDYWLEGIKIEFVEKMLQRMEELKMEPAVLAEKIGRKPDYIKRILRGTAKFDMVLMARIAMALGCELVVNMETSKTIKNL